MTSTFDSLLIAQTSIRILKLSQTISALSFSSFLVLHLSAPIASAISPPLLTTSKAESYASGFMVLGRVWYQGEWSEAVVVWGSLGVHVVSGVLGRIVKSWERKERRRRRMQGAKFEAVEKNGVEIERVKLEAEQSDSVEVVNVLTQPLEKKEGKVLTEEEEFDEMVEEEALIHPTQVEAERTPDVTTGVSSIGPITIHHITGYLLLPLALHHAFLHRILPAFPSAPYNSLSPTLMAYSFVGYSLAASTPLIAALSTLSYSAVLSLGSFHALSGLRRIMDPTAPIGLRARSTERGRKWETSYVVLLASIGVGVARLASEGQSVPGWLGKKYEIVLSKGFALA